MMRSEEVLSAYVEHPGAGMTTSAGQGALTTFQINTTLARVAGRARGDLHPTTAPTCVASPPGLWKHVNEQGSLLRHPTRTPCDTLRAHPPIGPPQPLA
jgi:hypothetical protein